MDQTNQDQTHDLLIMNKNKHQHPTNIGTPMKSLFIIWKLPLGLELSNLGVKLS